MVGIEYPLGSKDPKLGRVFLEEKDGTSGIMVAADTFWKNFEKYLED